MSERNLLIPILLVVVVGAPIVYHEMKSKQSSAPAETPENGFHQRDPISFSQPAGLVDWPGVTAQTADFSNSARSNNLIPTRNVSRPHVVPAEQPFQLSGFPRNVDNPVQNSPTNPAYANRGFDPRLIPIRGSEANSTTLPQTTALQPSPIAPSKPGSTQSLAPTSLPSRVAPILEHSQPKMMPPEGIDFSNMTPDYGAAETLVFPGNEFGPDLTAEPLEHLPVRDFGEIFHFDLTKAGVQRRWKRISTNPADFQNELCGMRIPLVTGTHTWDLHGSLTYYFDTHQQLQRITFRGWTGDPQKLVNWLTSQYQFKPQPTTLAGFYLGETRRKTYGGIMLKTPPVIDADNPFQQYGIVMEMNRPDGPFELSNEYRRLIAGSHPQ